MSTLAYSLAALAPSFAALALLALRDPKRLRNRHPGTAAHEPLSTAARRGLAIGSLLPGPVLAVSGQWPVLLIWLGATCTLGWALTQALAPTGSADDDAVVD